MMIKSDWTLTHLFNSWLQRDLSLKLQKLAHGNRNITKSKIKVEKKDHFHCSGKVVHDLMIHFKKLSIQRRGVEKWHFCCVVFSHQSCDPLCWSHCHHAVVATGILSKQMSDDGYFFIYFINMQIIKQFTKWCQSLNTMQYIVKLQLNLLWKNI